MDIVMAMAFFFIIVTMIFVAVAVFLPEWMGITGKKAKQIIADQQMEKKPASDDSTKDETKSDSDQPKPS